MDPGEAPGQGGLWQRQEEAQIRPAQLRQRKGRNVGDLCKETPPAPHTPRGLFKEETPARPLPAERPVTPSLASG